MRQCARACGRACACSFPEIPTATPAFGDAVPYVRLHPGLLPRIHYSRGPIYSTLARPQCALPRVASRCNRLRRASTCRVATVAARHDVSRRIDRASAAPPRHLGGRRRDVHAARARRARRLADRRGHARRGCGPAGSFTSSRARARSACADAPRNRHERSARARARSAPARSRSARPRERHPRRARRSRRRASCTRPRGTARA